MKKISN
jgi:hypothetical protein